MHADVFDNMGEKTWYFFTPREKKYLGGKRPNKSVAGELGYWKLTGKDDDVKHEGVCVGKKKTLSFFKGKQPSGQKTNWKMQEFIIINTTNNNNNNVAQPSMRLDDWVICKIYQTTYDHENI